MALLEGDLNKKDMTLPYVTMVTALFVLYLADLIMNLISVLNQSQNKNANISFSY
jgi:hypothetical protein